MELEMSEVMSSLSASLERLSAAAGALELTAAKLEQREAAISGDVQKITAAVDGTGEAARREIELERKLARAEEQIVQLQAQMGARPAAAVSARKTLPSATVQLLAKQGIDSLGAVDVGAVDAALAGLSIEQRLAVKAQLLRTGALVL